MRPTPYVLLLGWLIQLAGWIMAWWSWSWPFFWGILLLAVVLNLIGFGIHKWKMETDPAYALMHSLGEMAEMMKREKT